jgi:cytochrome P450
MNQASEQQSTVNPADGAMTDLDGDESRLDPLISTNPFPFYRALRSRKPVHYDPKLDVYLISRYDDVVAVLRDDEAFSLERGYQDRWANGHAEELAEILNRDGGGFIRDPVYDPPVHTRYRKLIEKAFTAHRVKSLEPRIRQIAADVLDPLVDRGHADGRMDIGVPMTARIICDQLGFDYAEVGADRIARWSMAIVAQMGRMQTREEMLKNAREICDLQNYIIRQIRDRENAPREDMTSDLVHARIPDEENPTLSLEEKIAWIRALLVGGNDTTATALSNLTFILATQPDVASQLAASVDDDRLMARFAEEILRIAPPTHGLFRTTTRDVEIAGTVIPADAQVCILFASGNDDESVFPSPRQFSIERQNSGRTLTFGGGAHRCVAAALARMEVKIAAQELIRRFDNIELAVPAEELDYLPTLEPRSLERVPMVFTKRGA